MINFDEMDERYTSEEDENFDLLQDMEDLIWPNSPIGYYKFYHVDDWSYTYDYNVYLDDEDDYIFNSEAFNELIDEYKKELKVFSDKKKAASIALSIFEKKNMKELLETIFDHIIKRNDDKIIGFKASIEDKSDILGIILLVIRSVEDDYEYSGISDDFICVQDRIGFVYVKDNDSLEKETIEDRLKLITDTTKEVYSEFVRDGFIKEIKNVITDIIPQNMRPIVGVKDIPMEDLMDNVMSMDLGHLIYDDEQ